MEEVRFQNCYSFMFSPRPGTAAALLEDNVPPEEKLRRLQELQKRQEEISSELLKSWVGREVEILVEGPASYDPKCFHGRSSQNIAVNMDEEVPGLKKGDLLKVKVTGTGRFSLRGVSI